MTVGIRYYLGIEYYYCIFCDSTDARFLIIWWREWALVPVNSSMHAASFMVRTFFWISEGVQSAWRGFNVIRLVLDILNNTSSLNPIELWKLAGSRAKHPGTDHQDIERCHRTLWNHMYIYLLKACARSLIKRWCTAESE